MNFIEIAAIVINDETRTFLNRTQLQVLRNSGKCKSAAAGENGMALVQIRDVMQHMIQFKYMLRSGMAADEQPHQTPRPAHASQPSHQAKRARANWDELLWMDQQEELSTGNMTVDFNMWREQF